MNKPIDIRGVVLKTERLTLRPWKETDVNDFYEYASVEEVAQMAGWPPHKNIEMTKIILSKFIESKRIFAIELGRKVIGSVAVKDYGESSYPELEKLQGRELGYVLSKPYWGQGIMPEAVRAVIEHLFTVEDFDFILCGCFVQNKQSARVIEKCGFQYYKTIELTTKYGKKEVANDSILYNPRKEKFQTELVSKYFTELSTVELYEILKARAEIFVVEQNCVYQDLDDVDYRSLHIFYRSGERVTAYLRAFSKDEEAKVVQMGRVLTLEHGTGLGGRILKEGIAQIKEKMKPEEIYIEAQCYAVGFYEREGFRVCSEEFLEDGIPHVQMNLRV